VRACHAINHSTLPNLIIMSSDTLAHGITSTILYSTKGIASSIVSVSALRGVCSLKAHCRRGQVTGEGLWHDARSRRNVVELLVRGCTDDLQRIQSFLQRTPSTRSTPSPHWQPMLLPGIWSARGTCMQARMLPHAASRELEELECQAMPSPCPPMSCRQPFRATLTDV
jgi:hypothetical protein